MLLPLERRRNRQVFVCGPTASGKSELLSSLFTSQEKRLISLDFTGEVKARNPDAIACYTWAELRETLTMLVTDYRDRREWHVAAMLEEADVPKLLHMLAPPITAADTVGFALAVGGLGLECHECDLIAPNGRTDPRVTAAFKRGRHHLLSLYMATQRPAECSRVVTSQAHHVVSMRQHEPNDIAWLERTMGRATAARVRELPPYHSAFFVPSTGCTHWLDSRYRVLSSTDAEGNAIP